MSAPENSAVSSSMHPGGRSVPAVARAAGILRVLADRGEASLTDLAGSVGIYKSTAHGILGTLAAFDLVGRDPTSLRYRLGSALVVLGRAAQGPGDLAVLARPRLLHLSRFSRETVSLHVADGDGSVIVASEESPQRLRVTAPPGFRMPAYAGAVAKVLGAFDPLPREVPVRALPAFTARSITGAQRWRRELEKVRRDGFALDDMEYQDGIRAVSVPVRQGSGGTGGVVAVYSIIAVASRVPAAMLRSWVPALAASADDLAAALRQSGGPDRAGGGR